MASVGGVRAALPDTTGSREHTARGLMPSVAQSAWAPSAEGSGPEGAGEPGMSPAERERKVRVDQFRGGASGAPRAEKPGTAHETEKTVREMRIEIAAAITSGEARRAAYDREDGS